MRTVAVVRGEALNPFELQSYAGISDDYRIVGIGSTDGMYEIDRIRSEVLLLRPKARTRLGARFYGDRARRLRGLGNALDGADVVHSAETFLPVSEQVAELRPRAGFKFVLTCWETIPFLHEDRAQLAERKQMVREAVDLFLPVTDLARRALLLENVPAEKIVVQPVGVDRRVFNRDVNAEGLLRRWNIPSGAPVILYCGRLIREKGIVHLVLALEHVLDAVLVIAGVGPEKPRLQAAARARGVVDRIRFVGHFPYHEMPRLYASADVFCLPSETAPYWEEQFGMVLAEAMCCGRPIIAAATGAIPEVVGDAGVLVPPSDPKELASALEHLVADADARAQLAAVGEQRAAERYDAESVARGISARYDSILA
jgi:glycosyltransferase involved in cell wall biosynthesis